MSDPTGLLFYCAIPGCPGHARPEDRPCPGPTWMPRTAALLTAAEYEALDVQQHTPRDVRSLRKMRMSHRMETDLLALLRLLDRPGLDLLVGHLEHARDCQAMEGWRYEADGAVVKGPWPCTCRLADLLVILARRVKELDDAQEGGSKAEAGSQEAGAE